MSITSGSFAEASKNISKIIAKTWLQDDTAEEIRTGLLSGEQSTIKNTLSNGTDGNGTDGVNLDAIFSEMNVYVFIDCSTFESGGVNGTFTQKPNTGQVVIVNIPLPPRPRDNALDDEIITCWINGSQDSDRVYSRNPYIARICSS